MDRDHKAQNTNEVTLIEAPGGYRTRYFRQGIVIGRNARGTLIAPEPSSVLVLGPRRSRPISTFLAPVLLEWPGSAVVTGRYLRDLNDVLTTRHELTPIQVFDLGSGWPTAGERVTWWPLGGCEQFDNSARIARTLVEWARFGHSTVEGRHWSERAESLLSVVLHAGALAGLSTAELMAMVDRRDLVGLRQMIRGSDSSRVAGVLSALAATETRERSSIWSTAQSCLAAFRFDASLASTARSAWSPQVLWERSARATLVAEVKHPEQEALIRLLIQAIGRLATSQSRLLLVTDDATTKSLAPVLVEPGWPAAEVAWVAQLASSASLRQVEPDLIVHFLDHFAVKLVMPGFADEALISWLCRTSGTKAVTARGQSVSIGSRWSGIMRSRSERIVPRLSPEDLVVGAPDTAVLFLNDALVGRIQAPGL